MNLRPLLDKLAYFFSPRRWSIGTRLQAFFKLVGGLTILLLGSMAYFNAKKNIEESVFQHLNALRDIRLHELEGYFKTTENQMVTFSDNLMVVEAMRQFRESFHSALDQEKARWQFSGAEQLLMDSASTELLPVDSLPADSAVAESVGAPSGPVPSTESTWPERARGIRAELEYYYQGEFLFRYNSGNTQEAQLEGFWPNSELSIFLQHQYVAENAHPTGQKHLLDQASSPIDYNQVHARYHPVFRDYLLRFGFYDIFLVDAQSGHIVYSVFKEVDFATSLLNGPYSRSNIAEVFKSAAASELESMTVMADFRPYAPSYGAPAAFIASPIYDGGQKIGVLIFQISIDVLNNIATGGQQWQRQGLGATGETYLVGQDFSLRTSLREYLERPEQFLEDLDALPLGPIWRSQIERSGRDLLIVRQDNPAVKSALEGQEGMLQTTDLFGRDCLAAFAPFKVGQQNFALVCSMQSQEAFAPVRRVARYVFLLVLLILALTVFFGFVIARNFVRPLLALRDALLALSQGRSKMALEYENQDEIGQTVTALNQLGQKLDRVSQFAQAVGQGDYQAELEPSSEEDALTRSLLAMRDNLRQAYLAEQQRQELDRKQAWVVAGLDKLQEVLRANTSSLEALGLPVAFFLAEYLRVPQVGIYFHDASEPAAPHYRLLACVAYDRKRRNLDKFPIDEGLIGRCHFERQEILLTELPDDYIRIGSGMGDRRPNSLLLMPLLNEGKMVGILELASFEPIAQEGLDLLRRASVALAAAFGSVLVTEVTAQLLERSRRQAEEMASQEEELRQNMEEMQAVQEEAHRREKALAARNAELERENQELQEQVERLTRGGRA